MTIGVFTRPVLGKPVDANDVRGNDNALGAALNTLDATVTALAAAAITGPVSSTDNAIVRWNGTGGDALEDSSVTVSDAGVLTVTSTTTPQTVVRYDASNRVDITVSSAGAVTMNAVGSSARFNFQDDVYLNDAGLQISANERPVPFFLSADNSTTSMTMAQFSASSTRASGTTPSLLGLVSNVTVVAGSATYTDVRAITAGVTKNAAGATITTGTAIEVNAISSAMGTARGIHVGSVTGGSTNYAIYTNSGTVRFGDVVNIASSSGLQVNGTKVVGAQGAAVTAPTGGTVQDSEARTAINDLISRLQAHGLIA